MPPPPVGAQDLRAVPQVDSEYNGLSKAARISLDKCIPEVPDRDAAGESALLFPVPQDAVELAFAGFALQAYAADMPKHPPMHQAARWLLEGLPVHDRLRRPEALLFFVDGSFKTPHTSWAVACLANVSGKWGWWGFLAHTLDERLGTGDAFAGELFGQLVALCTVAHERLPSAVFFDCESAARVVHGRTAHCHETPLRRAALSVAAYLDVVCCLPVFQHVRSHQGHPGNELADSLAKAALQQSSFHNVGREQHFVEFILEGSFDWLWAFPLSTDRRGLPQLRDGFATVPEAILEDKVCFRQPAQWAPQASAHQARSCRVSCRLATYNTLSCLSNLQRQCLHSFQTHHGIAVLGLQECRINAEPVQKFGHILRFASPAPDGQLGCQLWFNVAPSTGWTLHSFQLAFSHPRLLVVYAQLGSCRVACFSGHAPPAVATQEVRDAWWSLLRQRILALPPNTAPLMMLDANARFSRGHECEMPCNNNAEALSTVMAEFGLCRSKAYEEGGAARQSWRPPDGSAAVCLDYLLWPSAWADGFQDIGVRPILDEHVGIDHSPVLAEAQLQLTVPVRRPGRIDRAAMGTPEGIAQLEQLYASAPVVPWCVSLNDHVAAINEHLQQGIAALFPAAKQGPRKPSLSEHTWSLLKAKRVQRRCFRRQKALFTRWVVFRCFSAWARGPDCRGLRARVKAFDRLAAHHAHSVRCLTLAARRSQKQDDAAFARQSFQEARERGPDALAKQIRAVLKSGRSNRIAEVAVEVEVAAERVSEPARVKAAFAEHFGKAEKATPTLLSEMHHQCACAPGPDVLLEEIPSLTAVVAAFASLKSNKAAGIAQIPAEVYSRCPMRAALLHMPVLLKICSRRHFPTLWAGMLACALPKPNKPRDQLEGYRSVALVEPSAKGILKATRPILNEGFELVALPTVGGARKRHPADLAALSVQSHMSRLKRQGRSGAILYLDGVSAFYAVHRGHLFGGDLSCLHAHIQSLPLEPEVRRRISQAIGDRGALARAGIPVGTQQLLGAAFSSTWFVVDTTQEVVQATSRGTTPGSPLADILYQFVSEASIRCLSEHLVSENLAATCDGESAGATSLPQSWLDDVALLLEARDATQVGPVVARAASLAHQYLAVTGVDVNYAAGKTEAVLLFAGAGKSQARQKIFVQDQGCLQLALPGAAPCQLRCVGEYTHLGTVRTHNASCEAAVCRREQLTRAIYQPFKRRILSNDALTCRERQEMFKAMVLAKFLHGVGTFELGSRQALELFSRKYMGLVRGAVRPIYKVPCRRLNDAQVCALLDVCTPQEALDIATVRTWAYVVTKGDAYLRACVHGAEWLKALGPAMSRVAAGTGNAQLAAIAQNWTADRGVDLGFPFSVVQARHLLRTFRRHCVMSRRDLVDAALRKARAHQAAADAGLAYYHVERRCTPKLRNHVCPECALAFDTAAALGSHRAKIHAQAAASAHGFGTACEACRRQFWSTDRLREHLRKATRCSRVYVEADWTPGNAREVLAAPTVPPVPLVGPAPWWSVQHFGEVACSFENPAGPDPVALLPSVADVFHLAPFLRTWTYAVESGWEPPLIIPQARAGEAALLAVQIAEALGASPDARVLQIGELAAVVCGDTVLCGHAGKVREAYSSYWRDL